MIPLNTQPTEKQDLDPEGRLDVIHVWKTIQGEGPFAGMPAVFVRLAGCNLCCPLCDTDYTGISRQNKVKPDDLHQMVRALRGQSRLVVITGGEPFRQNIIPFINLLTRDRGLTKIQIETNGTMFLKNFPWEWVDVVCSPKTERLHPEMAFRIDALKYVVEAGHTDPEDGLPTQVLGKDCRVFRPPTNRSELIYVQPCDEGDSEKNAFHMEEAKRVCLKFGYRLCVQIHKIVGLE